MAKQKYVTTRSKLQKAFVETFSELRALPNEPNKAVMRLPYRRVLHGLLFEGSPQGYLWRLSFFSFCPSRMTRAILLREPPSFEFDAFWDMRVGNVFPDGATIMGRGLPGDDFLDAVFDIYRRGVRPWLEARSTPENLLRTLERPTRHEDISGRMRWSRSQMAGVIDYVITAMEAGRAVDVRDIVDDVLGGPDVGSLDKGDFAQFEELAAALRLSASELRAWLAEREAYTLGALRLSPSDLLDGNKQ